MAKIRIISHAVVKIEGQKEAYLGDEVEVSYRLGKHLVDVVCVAEWVKTVSKPEKLAKTGKNKAKTAFEAQND